ncbi:3-methyladenine DNA glycosylase AlkD [Clostridiales Family XIII bacterium PM5-7]
MTETQEKLFALQDIKHRDFNSKLLPSVEKERVIGVRSPQLKKLAKEWIKSGKSEEFLLDLPHYYLEENHLHTYIINQAGVDWETAITLVEAFLPYIDNWATCDLLMPKGFKDNPEKLYGKTLMWLKSDKTYTVRFALVMHLSLFLTEHFDEEAFNIIERIRSDEYYVQMAIAWYYSFALIEQYEKTIPIFQEKRLEKWVHNKALQKAIESYRLDKETKDTLRALKIK